MATLIDSSLNAVVFDYTGPTLPTSVDTPIPEGMEYPQWVNGAWQEYRVEDDPMSMCNNPNAVIWNGVPVPVVALSDEA